MLDVYRADDEYEEEEEDTTVSIILIITISAENKINCDICDQEAFIFQEEGNFCLNCWQDRTEPNIA